MERADSFWRAERRELWDSVCQQAGERVLDLERGVPLCLVIESTVFLMRQVKPEPVNSAPPPNYAETLLVLFYNRKQHV